MFKATGRLIYDPRGSESRFDFWWAKLETPTSIPFYYRYWIERELGIKLNAPLWRSHISVIRGEEPRKQHLWKKYAGKEIEFSYGTDVRMSETYAWIPVVSPELEAIREELGLRPQPRVNFHLTVGNCKNLEKAKKEVVLPFKTFPWEDKKIVDELWRKPKQ